MKVCVGASFAFETLKRWETIFISVNSMRRNARMMHSAKWGNILNENVIQTSDFRLFCRKYLISGCKVATEPQHFISCSRTQTHTHLNGEYAEHHLNEHIIWWKNQKINIMNIQWVFTVSSTKKKWCRITPELKIEWRRIFLRGVLKGRFGYILLYECSVLCVYEKYFPLS